MNRFQHDNIDDTITAAQRDKALKTSFAFRTKRRGNKPTGYDAWAGKRLEARRRAYDASPTGTRPGSMQRPS